MAALGLATTSEKQGKATPCFLAHEPAGGVSRRRRDAVVQFVVNPTNSPLAYPQCWRRTCLVAARLLPTVRREHCGWSPAPSDLAIARELYIVPSNARLDEARLDEQIRQVFENDHAHDFEFMRSNAMLQAIGRARPAVRSYGYLKSVDKPFFGAAHDVEGRHSGQFLAGDPETLIDAIADQRQPHASAQAPASRSHST